MELAPFSSPEDESMVAGVSKGHFPPPLWMRTAMCAKRTTAPGNYSGFLGLVESNYSGMCAAGKSGKSDSAEHRSKWSTIHAS
jgi:hypothetical protein